MSCGRPPLELSESAQTLKVGISPTGASAREWRIALMMSNMTEPRCSIEVDPYRGHVFRPGFVPQPDPSRAEFGEDQAQLLLEPWAVQAALRRRRGGQRLTDKERDDIRRSTRDPDCLRWPRGTDE
jgi:hypothetical protein